LVSLVLFAAALLPFAEDAVGVIVSLSS